MSYETVLEGLQERLGTVEGLAAVLDYVPTGIHTTPLVYTLFESLSIRQSGQVRTNEYRILLRVVLLWQDNEQAEAELSPFVESIPAAVRADPHLGGRLTSGYAEINELEGGWVTIGNVEYRVLDCHAHVIEKE